MRLKKELFSIFLILATLLGMAGFALTRDRAWTELIKPYGMTIALLLVATSFLRNDTFSDIWNRRQMLLGCVCYLFSVLLISLLPEAELFNWWIAGPVVAALYIHLYLGLAMQGILTLLLCGLYGYSIENLIFYGIIGLILCVLTRYITGFASFFYVLIIALSSNLTLIFIMNNLAWKQSTSKNAMYSLLSTLVVVAVAYLLHHSPKKEPEQVEEPVQIEEPVKSEEALWEEQLLEILSENFPLRKRLLEYSESLYSHSLHISSVAQEAALCIGCQDKIVQAGGFYHEIGRIAGRDYIEEGVKLGLEYALPEPVIDIIRQHNSKYEKPRSVEAAVVMITDSIVSTIEYMEKEQEEKNVQVSVEKIIEQIFDIRLKKGTLDESGMDICNYKKLKEFFQREYSKGAQG